VAAAADATDVASSPPSTSRPPVYDPRPSNFTAIADAQIVVMASFARVYSNKIDDCIFDLAATQFAFSIRRGGRFHGSSLFRVGVGSRRCPSAVIQSGASVIARSAATKQSIGRT
jgi:hypothetical protein